MPYRVTRRARERRHWRPRPEVPPEDRRPETWSPPDLRRVVVIVDLDSGVPVTHRIEMRRTRRIDVYAVSFDGAPPKRMGWSAVLAMARKGLPRVLSPAAYE